MQKIIALLALVFPFGLLTSQSCSINNIVLTTQAEVNAFQANFGPCDSVLTRLVIGGYGANTDINDLTPLDDLVYAEDLWVIDNPLLTSLSGFENLDVDGVSKLIVQDNDIINDISQLSGFGPAVGDLGIVNNPLLADLTGLENIEVCGTAFNVRDLPLITDLDVFSNLTSVARVFTLTNNDALTDITGLSNLVSFGGSINHTFWLNDNASLEDCSTLCSIIQYTLPTLSNLNKIIQNNLNDCLNEAAILNVCQSNLYCSAVSNNGFIANTGPRIVGAVNLYAPVNGKAIVSFDGVGVASFGDRIYCAASDITNPAWAADGKSIYFEVPNDDQNSHSFSHTMVYDIAAGTTSPFYAIVEIATETAGTGIMSVNGKLTVQFIPDVSLPEDSNTNPFIRAHSLGDIYIENVQHGVIMKSPDGTCWRMKVTDQGDSTFEKVSCP